MGVIALLCQAVAAFAAVPTVALISSSTGSFLGDASQVVPANGGAVRTLQVGGSRVALPAASHARSLGKTVGVVSKETSGTQVSIFDVQGQPLLSASLPAGVSVQTFGEAAAYYRGSQDGPGFPYAIDVVNPQGSVHRERPGRTILSLRALEDYLVVSSTDAQGEVIESEVIDGSGTTRWTFVGRGEAIPRVVAHGTTAAAIYSGRPSSLLQVVDHGTGQRSSLPIANAILHDVAILADGSGILVWGGHDAALVDSAGTRVRWQAQLSAPGREYPVQLSTSTSSVTPVANTLASVIRERADGDQWDVSVVFFDLATGQVAGRQPLYRDTHRPNELLRMPRGAAERLVLPQRVYEIRAQ